MNKLSWAAIRHLEALRESIASTLTGSAVTRGIDKPEEFFAGWLKEQGVTPRYYRVMPEETLKLDMRLSMQETLKSHGVDLFYFNLVGRASRYADTTDVGVERSGTGWQRLPNFITSSAYVRLLGAMEQFEIDTLKTLLHYRPEGKGYKAGRKVIEAAIEVATEEPDQDDRYTMPALWSWLKRPAENTVERRKVFKTVYEIECYPAKFSGMSDKQIRAYYNEMYKKRNAIAHGRALVEISLAEYCRADAFVLALVEHMAEQCVRRYKIAI